CAMVALFSLHPRPLTSTLFPYTTLFRSVQFHPEVVHTPRGAAIYRNFTHGIAGLSGDWTMAAFKEESIARIRAQVGKGRVICGLDRKSTRLNSSHVKISYAVFCLKKKTQ